MDVHVRKLAADQLGLVAAWQLLALGWSVGRVRHWSTSHGWQAMHDGVFLLSQAPPTREQRWMAATLTSPGSVLSHASAGACWGFRPWEGAIETITRPGDGGPRIIDRLLVSRSRSLWPETTRQGGIPITSAARTIIDLAPHLTSRQAGRAFREAVRLKLLTARDLAAVLERHRGRRGTRKLWVLAERYASIPYTRTRSNAEARALEVLYDAGLLPDKVNAPIAGEEADLIWLERQLIIEIDGPQFHLFADEDARKQSCWSEAGFTVRRITSQDVYDNPAALISLVTQ